MTPDNFISKKESTLYIEIQGIGSWESHWVILGLLKTVDQKGIDGTQSVFIKPSENSIDVWAGLNTSIGLASLVLQYVQFKRSQGLSPAPPSRRLSPEMSRIKQRVPPGLRQLVSSIFKYVGKDPYNTTRATFGSIQLKEEIGINARSIRYPTDNGQASLGYRPESNKITFGQMTYIKEKLNDLNSLGIVHDFLERIGKSSLEVLTIDEAEELIDSLRGELL